MGWFILAQLFSKLITLVSLGRLSEREKDLEILLLCPQSSIPPGNRFHLVRATQVERLTLTDFIARLKEIANRSVKELGEIIRLFQPETVLGWHRG
jgi:hypothetical protein